MGLWILQECKRAWEEEGKSFSYDELCSLAENVPPRRFAIDVNDPGFLKPGIIGDPMPERIRGYCAETGQGKPSGAGEVTRCVLESPAAQYARTLDSVELCTGRTVNELHIIGGGSRNDFLNRLTAEAAGRAVLPGPAEATALGNIMTQAMAAGHAGTLQEGRALIRAAFPPFAMSLKRNTPHLGRDRALTHPRNASSAQVFPPRPEARSRFRGCHSGASRARSCSNPGKMKTRNPRTRRKGFHPCLCSDA
jgi:sugar (pentulose or hexulose) kinase